MEEIEENGEDIIITEVEKISEDINVLMKDYEKKKKEYKSSHSLTKFEKTRILFSNAYDIAVQELNEKRIPFIIKRPYGNTFEYWKLNDLMKK